MILPLSSQPLGKFVRVLCIIPPVGRARTPYSMGFSFFRRARPPLAGEDYLSMSTPRAADFGVRLPGSAYTPPTTSTASNHAATSSASAPSGAAAVGSVEGSESGRVLRARLVRMFFGRRRGSAAGTSSDGISAAAAAAAELAAERQRWTEERRMLLDEVTALRTNAISADAQLEGWSALVRDILFYGFLHGRQQALLDHFAASLRSSIGEVDGVSEVEVGARGRLPVQAALPQPAFPHVCASACVHAHR